MALNVTDYLPYFFTPACTFLYHLKKKKEKKKFCFFTVYIFVIHLTHAW